MSPIVTQDPPATVMTNRERRDLIEGVTDHGVQCATCGREANPGQIDAYLDQVERDPEPGAWVCPNGWHICGPCKGEGAMPGLAGEICSDCKGTGEYDEHDTDPWPTRPSERGL